MLTAPEKVADPADATDSFPVPVMLLAVKAAAGLVPAAMLRLNVPAVTAPRLMVLAAAVPEAMDELEFRVSAARATRALLVVSCP
ncbi:MAG: hypothetical protein ACKON9_31415, partial [Planctomycetaceae bacterium]